MKKKTLSASALHFHPPTAPVPPASSHREGARYRRRRWGAGVRMKMGGQRREECEREKDKRKGSRGRRRREQKKLKTQNLLLAYLDVSHHGPADEHVLHRRQLFVCLFVFFGILLSSVSKRGTRERRREEGKEGERKNLPAGAARARRR